MNADVRLLYLDGERAARDNEPTTARACFLEAGETAAELQLLRSAIRCYRAALELDLTDQEPIDRVMRMPPRVISGRGWDEYQHALAAHRQWPHFGCRGAQVVIGDAATTVACTGAGAVLELLMTEHDLVEAQPDRRFTGMPITMALVILRRALWPAPRERASTPMHVRIAYAGRQQVLLDELGDWDPVVGSSLT